MKIVFLGHLKDTAGQAEKYIEPKSSLSSVKDLIALVCADNEALQDALSQPSIRVIINKSILAKDALPDQINEVAFMPPLSGG